MLPFLFEEETRAAIYVHATYTDNSSSKVDSLAFMKLLILYNGIIKVIMALLPFTQLSHSELLFF